ncbi:uncharacterized protein LOC119377530 [Rhipicephalus sanguineus]|uniref:uncharacterized protein LOC119377530 n=1 Tax=Rhipicephalus sanguineus TaxID=34632 RepID=UPI0020C2197D|nr:uncharacterized protein LOC119377530 [Rhipicephalus sanguineus]
MAFNRMASPMFLVFLAAIGSGAGAKDEAPSVLRSMLLAFVREASGCDSLKTVLGDSDKVALVAYHNDYRSQVAGGGVKVAGGDTLPKASNMKKLKWDDALAKTAQATADKCDGKTRETAATALDTDELPEKTSDSDVGKFVKNIVTNWYTEGSKTFKAADLDSYPATTTDGHLEDFAQEKDGGDSTSTSGESKAGGGSSAVAIIGILAALVAVGGVVVGLVMMHRTKARAAAAAHAAAAAPAAASAPASASEQGAAAGSHEAAAGDATDHKGSPGAEAEKTAEAHESPPAATMRSPTNEGDLLRVPRGTTRG